MNCCDLDYIRYMHGWELDAALDVLTMCSCHLTETDPLSSEVGFLPFFPPLDRVQISFPQFPSLV